MRKVFPGHLWETYILFRALNLEKNQPKKLGREEEVLSLSCEDECFIWIGARFPHYLLGDMEWLQKASRIVVKWAPSPLHPLPQLQRMLHWNFLSDPHEQFVARTLSSPEFPFLDQPYFILAYQTEENNHLPPTKIQAPLKTEADEKRKGGLWGTSPWWRWGLLQLRLDSKQLVQDLFLWRKVKSVCESPTFTSLFISPFSLWLHAGL